MERKKETLSNPEATWPDIRMSKGRLKIPALERPLRKCGKASKEGALPGYKRGKIG